MDFEIKFGICYLMLFICYLMTNVLPTIFPSTSISSTTVLPSIFHTNLATGLQLLIILLYLN